MTVIINEIEYIPKVSQEVAKDKESFGEALKAIRIKTELSLCKAAVSIGISKAFLSDLENDKVEPSLRSAVKICSAYGIPITALSKYFE